VYPLVPAAPWHESTALSPEKVEKLYLLMRKKDNLRTIKFCVYRQVLHLFVPFVNGKNLMFFPILVANMDGTELYNFVAG